MRTANQSLCFSARRVVTSSVRSDGGGGGVSNSCAGLLFSRTNHLCRKNLDGELAKCSCSRCILILTQTRSRKNIDSALEQGGAFAVYYKGELVVELYGGHADREADWEWNKDVVSQVGSSPPPSRTHTI